MGDGPDGGVQRKKPDRGGEGAAGAGAVVIERECI